MEFRDSGPQLLMDHLKTLDLYSFLGLTEVSRKLMNCTIDVNSMTWYHSLAYQTLMTPLLRLIMMRITLL